LDRVFDQPWGGHNHNLNKWGVTLFWYLTQPGYLFWVKKNILRDIHRLVHFGGTSSNPFRICIPGWYLFALSINLSMRNDSIYFKLYLSIRFLILRH
jgi:hypothetical protein